MTARRLAFAAGIALLVAGCATKPDDSNEVKAAKDVLSLRSGTVTELKARRGTGPFLEYDAPPDVMLDVVTEVLQARVPAVFPNRKAFEVVAKERRGKDPEVVSGPSRAPPPSRPRRSANTLPPASTSSCSPSPPAPCPTSSNASAPLCAKSPRACSARPHIRRTSAPVDNCDIWSQTMVMNTIGAAEFKARCLRIMDEVGPEGIVITKRGKPVAMLLPAEEAAGMARFRGAFPDLVINPADDLSTAEAWNNWNPGRGLDEL